MRTSDVARIVGCTPRTIRHYHQIGLVDESSRDANGYRNYSPTDVAQALRVKVLAEAGVPLSRVENGSQSDNAAAFDAALELLDEKIARLQVQRQRLVELSQMALSVPEDVQALLRSVFESAHFADNEIASLQVMALSGVANEETWEALRQRLMQPEVVVASRRIEELWGELGDLREGSSLADDAVAQIEPLFPDSWIAGIPLAPAQREVSLVSHDVEMRGAQQQAFELLSRLIAEHSVIG